MTEINWWIMKSEPDVYGIKDLEREGLTLWDGIRNYQARNFMRQMKINDKAFFYHSNCKPPGIAGLMKVTKTRLIDPTQFDPKSKYFDPKSTKNAPRWDCVQLQYLGEYNQLLSLEDLRNSYTPEDLSLLRKGNRLSIVPITKDIADSLSIKLGKLNKAKS